MRKINVNLFPKGGYVFKENDGTIITSSNWKGVFARVTEYRRRNNFPSGNPEQEVMEQACKSNPGICTDETPQMLRDRRRVSLKGRWLAWLSEKIRLRAKEPLVFVDEEAPARANICANCPENQAMQEGCSSCRSAVNEMRRTLIGGKAIDGRLHGCAVLSQDNAVAIYLDEQRVDEPDLPTQCWRKRC
jgi:hypothetical protein